MATEPANSAALTFSDDDAACGLLQTDLNGTILRVNNMFCEWVGYTRKDLVGVRKFQELLTIGGRIFHQTHWVPLMQMQGSVSEVKLEAVHSDGHRIPIVVNAVRRERDGKTVHELAAYVARDRDAYERELVKTSKRLEELVAEVKLQHEAAKDRALFAEQMMGIVSHDLRNPISVVHMSAILLGHELLTGNQQNIVGRISRATDRATRLIGDLLDFTQARLGGGITVTRTPVELHTIVSETVDELAHAFPTRVIRHVTVGTGRCRADVDRLAQLVGNLVSNAVAYGNADSVITVTSTAGEKECSVQVHNEGAPIPHEKLESLFKPMTRAASGSGGDRSVGLGLFIVSEIAKAHAGEVLVSSTAEGGTAFTIHIPIDVPA